MPSISNSKTFERYIRLVGTRMISNSPPIGPVPFDVYDNYQSFPLVVSSRVWSKNPTQDYKTLKKFRRLPVNPYRMDFHSYGSGYFRGTYSSPPTGGQYSTSFKKYYQTPACTTPLAFSPPSMDKDSLNNDLLNKIKGVTWNAPVSAVEARKTMDMVTLAAYRFVGAIRALRRGDIVSAANFFGASAPSKSKINRFNRKFGGKDGSSAEQAIASGLLEIRYGWMPTILDIHSAAETLANKFNNPAFTETTVKSRSSKVISQRGSNKVVSGSPLWKVNAELTSRLQMELSVTFRRDNTESLSRFGMTNPALVIWELTPLSFVYDWLHPLGDYLSALDATVAATFVRGRRSVKELHVYFGELTYMENYPIVAGTDTREWGSFTRERLIDFPRPTLPKVDPSLSLSRMTSALALFQTIVRNKKG